MDHPDPRKRPHPVLINTMLLNGIAFGSFVPNDPLATSLAPLPPSTPSTTSLLHRIQRDLNDSLAQVDRLEDYFSAAGLLIAWFYRLGRFQEAQYLSSTTAR